MTFFLFGNIGSGKSEVAKRLLSHYPLTYFSIDEYRMKFSDGTMELEEEVKLRFIEDIKANANSAIIETVGTGKLNDMLFEVFKDRKEIKVIFILHTKSKVCVKRCLHRKWEIPFPAVVEEVYSYITSINIKISHRTCFERWENLSNIYYFKRPNNKRSHIEKIVKTSLKLINEFRTTKHS